jgi:hypothetical protein
MSELAAFKLGGVEYPIEAFTLGEVQRLLPLLSTAGTQTVPQMAAMVSAVHIGVQRSAPEMKFEDFQKLPGVTALDLLAAFRAIGLKIGFFRPVTPPPGEAVAGEGTDARNRDENPALGGNDDAKS